MGQITLQIPQTGLTNATEDPKIASDFNVIQTVVNGNIDTNNISPTAGILGSQLSATAGITLAQLAAGVGRLSLVAKTANYTAANGELVMAGNTGAPFSVTAPSPTTNAKFGVIAGGGVSGSALITILPHVTETFYALGVQAAAFVFLGTPWSHLIFQSDGANWIACSGQPDTGWQPLTAYSGTVSNAAGYLTPGALLRGDTVRLRGVLSTSGTIPSGTSWATVPGAMRPTYTNGVVLASAGGGAGGLLATTVGADGRITAASSVTLGALNLDGLTYTTA